jgi:penicillin-binding protein 1A
LIVDLLGLGNAANIVDRSSEYCTENKLPTVAKKGDIDQEPTVRGMGQCDAYDLGVAFRRKKTNPAGSAASDLPSIGYQSPLAGLRVEERKDDQPNGSNTADPPEVAAQLAHENGAEEAENSVGQRRSRRRRPPHKLHPIARLIRKLARLVTLLVGSAVGVTAMIAAFALLGMQLPKLNGAVSFPVAKLGALEPLNQRSEIVDSQNRLMIVLRSEQNRQPVTFDRIPKHMINAVLAVEDADFYRHKGINMRSTVRAMVANVEAGGVAQGGSTITQQLVKLTLLSSKQNVNRKVTEARLALQIEKQLSKEQILERYLNTVYFGEGSYGVQAAAERYFNKRIDDITVVEAAFLAGMIRNPVGYDPIRFKDRSRQRRGIVLERMVKVGMITKAEQTAYRISPMPRPADRFSLPESYFIEEVKQQLLDDKRLGATKAERYTAVFNGGLRIKTTFDPDIQAQAEAAVRDVLPAYETDFTAALVSLDVATGAVKAMVGGRGFATDKYNLVTQGKRQPGSSWKPFVLVAAMENGISPMSLVDGNEPCPIPNPTGKPKVYKPRNAEPPQAGPRTILDQLVVSSNCAFARLAYLVGYKKVADVAKRLGITTRIDLVPSMALGVEEVHPIDIAGAYATLAAGGRQRKAYLIDTVYDRTGKVIFTGRSTDRQIVDKEIARVVTSAMQGVVQRGTGVQAQIEGRDVAGKTGTTNNNEDAWFVGFTPQLATAVWMGAPDRKLAMKNVGGFDRVYGGDYPALVWNRFMSSALQSRASEPFDPVNKQTFDLGDCFNLTVEQVKKRSTSAGRGSRTSTNATVDESVNSAATPTTTVPKLSKARCGSWSIPNTLSRESSDDVVTSGTKSSKKKKKKSGANTTDAAVDETVIAGDQGGTKTKAKKKRTKTSVANTTIKPKAKKKKRPVEPATTNPDSAPTPVRVRPQIEVVEPPPSPDPAPLPPPVPLDPPPA